MIDVPIVDAHHHLQELSRGYPWLEGPAEPFRYHGDDRPLRRDYRLADYLAEWGPLELVGCVHVENGAADSDAETGWISEVSRAHGFPSAHVARLDLLAADVGEQVDRLSQIEVVRGVRYMLNWHEKPLYRHVDRRDLMTDQTWRAGFALLADHDLSFDLQVFPSQLLEARDLAERFPDTRIILDHAGMPIRRDADGIAEWRRGMQALARRENVSVKISALGTNDHDWTTESIRGFVRETIETFGPERAMFASNFPVDGLYSSLLQLYSAFDELTADLTHHDRALLFGGTARAVYRLG